MKYLNHKAVSIIFALAFFGLVQSFNSVFRFLLPAMLIYGAVVLAYNLWYIRQKNFYSLWSWLRSLFFLLALLAIYFVLPANFSRGLFLVLSAVFIYFMEQALLVASEQVTYLQTLLSFFGFSLAAFALNYFLLPQSPIILVLLCLATFLVSRSSLDYVPATTAKKNFFSGVLALSILEASWALIFLPLHFTAIAIILFNIFYVLWLVVYYHLFNNLNAKKISFHVIFSSIIIALVLTTTPWK